MTNYNERLDEILQQNIQVTLLGGFPNAVPDHSNWVNVMGGVYSFDFTEARQALTSLIKELVAEAKPPAIDTSSRINLYADDEGQMWYDRGQNDTIARFEQNLLKALEEV